MDHTQTTANPLGYEKIGKLLTSYAIPSIIALIINSLYNMVDQIFIGQGVGFLGNGATNIIAPIATITIAIATLFGDGLAAFFSLSLGKGEGEKAAKSLGTSIMFGCIFGIVFGLTGILMAGPAADALAFVLSGAFCIKEIKKMEQMDRSDETYEKIGGTAV